MRNYCASYGFDLGIGEYGSVIVDMVRGKEISLIDDEVVDEISQCRKILEDTEGVFVDVNYRYSIRAYRYNSSGACGLGKDESKGLLRQHGFRRLRVITRDADTYFVGKNTNKGEAIQYFKNHVGYSGDSIIAIGDSDEDLEMLENVPLAFAPHNCSEGIRRMSRHGKCSIVSRPGQRGLLQVAEKIAGATGEGANSLRTKDMLAKFINTYDENSFQHMMSQLLTVAESPRYKRILSLFL